MLTRSGLIRGPALAQPLVPSPFSPATTTTHPTAGTGSTESTGSSSSSGEAPGQATAAFPSSHHVPASEGATNPALLHFVGDSLAIYRVSASELPQAFTLFDATMQTRLAVRDPAWSLADCLAASATLFSHLGTTVFLGLVADEVAGLPSPQITAIAEADSLRSRVLPIDGRSVGLGICVANVPRSSSPFTAAYIASSHCSFTGLQHRVARGHVSAIGRGQRLPPFDDIT